MNGMIYPLELDQGTEGAYLRQLTELGRGVLGRRYEERKLESHLGTVQSGAWTANMKRMMDELVDSQFTKPELALRENVQNARDARPKTGIYVGTAGQNELFVVDDGVGMDKTDVQRYLLGIFNSSKAEDEEAIGRFGIGRLANFKIADVVLFDTKKAGSEPITIAITGKLGNGDSYQIYEFPGTRTTEGTTVVLLMKEGVARREEYVLQHDCAWISTPLYFNGNKMNKPFDIETEQKIEFEEDGVRGVIGLSDMFGNSVQILQSGIKVSDKYVGFPITGLVDSKTINPVIGRAGVVEDEEHERVVNIIYGKTLELASRIAEQGVLTQSEANFLRHVLREYHGNDSKRWKTHGLPIPIRGAKIIQTVFGKNIEHAGGDLLTILKYTLAIPDSDAEYLSLEDLRKAGKGNVFFSPLRTQVAEDLRREGKVVVKARSSYAETDYLERALDWSECSIKSIEEVEQDIDIRPHEYGTGERLLLRTFEEYGIKGVKIANIRKRNGETFEGLGALHNRKEGIIININSPFTQKAIELAQYRGGKEVATILMQQILTHELSHRVGVSGSAHPEEFYLIQQRLTEELSMKYAEKRLQDLKESGGQKRRLVRKVRKKIN